MIGWHVDTYFKFRSSCPEYDESEYLPIRFMYFPLQHQNGHAFSVEKEWLTSWEAGTGITRASKCRPLWYKLWYKNLRLP